MIKKHGINISKEFQSDFEELEKIILQSKQKIWYKVNYEQIYLYWFVGSYVSFKQSKAEWGQKVVANFARFLKQRNPQLKEFDKRAIYRMVQFFNTYSVDEFVVALQPLFQDKKENQIVAAMPPQLQSHKIDDFNNPIIEFLAQISWSAHLKILSACNTYNNQSYITFY